MDLPPLATFGIFVAVGLPVILAVCYGFQALFEAPFLRRRDTRALRAIPIFMPAVWRLPARFPSVDLTCLRHRLPAWATSRRGRE